MVFVKVTKNYEEILNCIFPELLPTEAGLLEAIQIAFPFTTEEIKEQAYNKILWSFEYLIEKKDKKGKSIDFFIPVKVELSEAKGFYNKKNANLNHLDFETYLEYIIEVILFSRDFDDNLRKDIENYYDELGYKIENSQNHRSIKIAQLASYLIIGPQPRKGTAGQSWKSYSCISVHKCYFVLEAIFINLLQLNIRTFNTLDSFKENFEKYRASLEIGHHDDGISYYDIEINAVIPESSESKSTLQTKKRKKLIKTKMF